jgi:hypothetical protein
MLETQKYLIKNGLAKLKEEFKIEVREYQTEGISVFNYSMIDSPRFHPIADECRGLILKNNTWEIVAYPFNRFMNWGEGVQKEKIKNINTQRVSSFNEYETKDFNILKAILENKIDGSIMVLRNENDKWKVSSRSMAYAEGTTNFGITFEQCFMDAEKKTNLFEFLRNNPDMKKFTFIFELIGPYNRVVTKYDKNEIILLGCRNIEESNNYRELTVTELDNLASLMKVKRPEYYKAESYEELMKIVESFPTLDEGVVLKIENMNGSHWRIKLKNPAYLAVAHLRSNGKISPKRVLHLVMTNDHSEYLQYFECDAPYFDFTENLYIEVKERIKSIYRDHMAIKDQKEFALAIMPKTAYGFEQGIIFNLRKKGGTVEDHLNNVGSEKIAKSMNLKQKFIDKFHIIVEDDDVA